MESKILPPERVTQIEEADEILHAVGVITVLDLDRPKVGASEGLLYGAVY
jgi:hypothetical protein